MVASAHGTEGRSPSRLGRMSARAAASRPSRAVRLPIAAPGRRPQLLSHRRMSLYVRVVVVNAVILAAATALLVFTPATVSFPVAVDQGVILAGGLIVLIVANACSADQLPRPGGTRPANGDSRPPAAAAAPSVARRARDAGADRRLQRRCSNDWRRSGGMSTRRTFSALEGERRRVGQELHDEIGQRLTGILLQLGRRSSTRPPARAGAARCGAGAGSRRARRGRRARLAAAAGMCWTISASSRAGALAQAIEEHSTLADRARAAALAPRTGRRWSSPSTGSRRRPQQRAPPRGREQGRAGAARRRATAAGHSEVTDDGRGISADSRRARASAACASGRCWSAGGCGSTRPGGRATRVRLDVPRERLAASRADPVSRPDPDCRRPRGRAGGNQGDAREGARPEGRRGGGGRRSRPCEARWRPTSTWRSSTSRCPA